MTLVFAVIAVVWGFGPGARAQSTKVKQPQADLQSSDGSSRLDKYLEMYRMTDADRQAAAARAAAARAAAGPYKTQSQLDLDGAALAVPNYFGSIPNYTNSPIINKFVDSLPGVGAGNANNLGQYIPIAIKDTTTFTGSDNYKIGLVDYYQKLHTDLISGVNGGQGTKLRGYKDLTAGADGNAHYLGPLIIANRNTPVRITFTNQLGTGTAGNLFVPVDTTMMGAGTGPDGTNIYTENRSVIHLHGGLTPWISDGTPHQRITPAGEVSTIYTKGVSAQNVPDMWFDPTTHLPVAAGTPGATNDPGPGSATYYYTNQQSSRLMFYHEHALGTTRLGVYAGIAAGYLLTDSTEEALIATGTIPGPVSNPSLPAEYHYGIPLIIQDKTFVPNPTTLAATDPTWDSVNYGGLGNLWLPHVYMPNQNPWDTSGANAMGRWDYALWFWPPYTGLLNHGTLPNPLFGQPGQPPENPGIPNPTIVPESFMDTPVVNGTPYPYLTVERKAYRFRILNASNDRFWNLQLYYADPLHPTEVKMLSALPHLPEITSDFGASGLWFNQAGGWTQITASNPVDTVYSADGLTLYANFGTLGLWKYDGAAWTQLSGSSPVNMVSIGSALFAGFGNSGLWKFDGSTGIRLSEESPQNMVTSGTALYADFGNLGLWKYNGTVWTQLTGTNPANMATSGAGLYASFTGLGLWKHNGTSWTQLTGSDPVNMIPSGAFLYAGFGALGLWKYDGTAWTQLTTANPSNMAVSGSALYAGFAGLGTWKYDGSWIQISGSDPTTFASSATALYAGFGAAGTWKYDNSGWTELSPTNPDKLLVNSWPETWPTDGRAGGVPDPTQAGPQIVQIGTEGGFLPAPVVLPNTPIGYNYNRRDIVVLNVENKTLFMGPAERADVIIDFSQVPDNSTIILYNDAPAPVPAFDTRYDYYTGDPDQTATGGAPTTAVGKGPNTRTIMQFRVAAGNPGTAFNMVNLQNTATGLPHAYALSQDPPVVPQAAYSSANGGPYPTVYTDTMGVNLSRISDTSLTFAPFGSTTATTVPMLPKAIQELFETNYGRMNATLGVELPFTNSNNQTTVPFGFIDPPTETISGNQTQIWKITHNGVDTHAIHFHLFNVQLINRVGWDGAIRPPDANELGWKETVKMNPLEDAIVAMKPAAPIVPFSVPSSNRLLDPTQLEGATMNFSPLDPDGNPVTTHNVMTNFGWEYVWHCHLLGHEENDMMRPIVFIP
jgi:FtsP/CotA-like multicopper oxidase with cupredoxin domain